MELPPPCGFHVPEAAGHFQLVLIMHNESTFFQNNQCKIGWDCEGSSKASKLKGDGQSLMILDFLTTEWGCLCNDNRCVLRGSLSYADFILFYFSDAHIVFKPWKFRDG